VALSAASSLDGLYLLRFDRSIFGCQHLADSRPHFALALPKHQRRAVSLRALHNAKTRALYRVRYPGLARGACLHHLFKTATQQPLVLVCARARQSVRALGRISPKLRAVAHCLNLRQLHGYVGRTDRAPVICTLAKTKESREEIRDEG